MDTPDRRERTVYVAGMHPSVSEEILYDLFQRAGPVEKVVLHEHPDGSPRHALIVFKHVQSVMYAISMLNGTALYDRPLSMRPLRESSHALVLQQGSSHARPRQGMQVGLGEGPHIPPPPPPASPRDNQEDATDDEKVMVIVNKEGGKRDPILAQSQDSGKGSGMGGNKDGSPPSSQMWMKYTEGACSAASQGINDWFPSSNGGGGGGGGINPLHHPSTTPQHPHLPSALHHQMHPQMAAHWQNMMMAQYGMGSGLTAPAQHQELHYGGGWQHGGIPQPGFCNPIPSSFVQPHHKQSEQIILIPVYYN